MSELGFTPTAFHKLVGFILRELNREVGAVELAKFLYLIDVDAMKLMGRTITGDEYTRVQRGPLPMHFYSIIEEMSGAEIERYIKPTLLRAKHCHRLGKKPRFEFDLLPEEELVARKVIEGAKELKLSELISLAYETEPMRKILKREQTAGWGLLQGEHVDLVDVSQNQKLARWRKNKNKHEASSDPEYEMHLLEELKQAEEILST